MIQFLLSMKQVTIHCCFYCVIYHPKILSSDSPFSLLDTIGYQNFLLVMQNSKWHWDNGDCQNQKKSIVLANQTKKFHSHVSKVFL